jgi:hypothetical protein
VHDQREHLWRGTIASDRSQEESHPFCIWELGAQVVHLTCEWREKTKIDQFVHTVREQPCSDQDQRCPGPTEEALQIESRAELEDCSANSNGNCEAGDRAEENPHRITGCGHGGGLPDQEERRLNALTDYRGEGEAANSEEWSGDECLINPLAKFTAHRDSLSAHPEEHPGDNGAC